MFAIGSMLTIPLLFTPLGETMLEKIKKNLYEKCIWFPDRECEREIKAKKRFSPPMSIDSPYLSGSPQVAGPVGTGLREAEHRHHRATLLKPPMLHVKTAGLRCKIGNKQVFYSRFLKNGVGRINSPHTNCRKKKQWPVLATWLNY